MVIIIIIVLRIIIISMPERRHHDWRLRGVSKKFPRRGSTPKKGLRENRAIPCVLLSLMRVIALFSWSLFLGLELGNLGIVSLSGLPKSTLRCNGRRRTAQDVRDHSSSFTRPKHEFRDYVQEQLQHKCCCDTALQDTKLWKTNQLGVWRRLATSS